MRKEAEKARVEAHSAEFMNRLDLGTEAGNSLNKEFQEILLGPYADSKM